MERTVNELDDAAKKYGFGSAMNAITCADIYRNSFSKERHDNDNLKRLIVGLKLVLTDDVNIIIDNKLKEFGIDLTDFKDTLPPEE